MYFKSPTGVNVAKGEQRRKLREQDIDLGPELHRFPSLSGDLAVSVRRGGTLRELRIGDVDA
jgi:hypothetical protein